MCSQRFCRLNSTDTLPDLQLAILLICSCVCVCVYICVIISFGGKLSHPVQKYFGLKYTKVLLFKFEDMFSSKRRLLLSSRDISCQF